MALIVTVSMLNLERTTILRNRRQGPFESSEIKEDRLRGYNLVCSLADHLTSWPSIAHTCRNDSAIFPFFFYLELLLAIFLSLSFSPFWARFFFQFSYCVCGSLCYTHSTICTLFSRTRSLSVKPHFSYQRLVFESARRSLNAHGVLWMRTAFFEILNFL